MKQAKDEAAVAVRTDEEAPSKSAEVVMEAADKGQAASGYEDLTLWQTVAQFKYASLYCFLAAMSAAADGYQLS